MEKRKIQGLLSFEIIKKKDDLLGELKSALKELFKTYIETTPIEIEKLEFEELDNEIRVEYEFTNVIFHYKHQFSDDKFRERTSTENNAEFGRAIFEFYTKLLVENFFKDYLKVSTRHTEITFFKFKGYETI
ncbi:hypothetical protein [Bacillus inaquosorum]|uniref:hypothetical protein n=1 Tax=Bacillus inaquosorum TaxID=483913 RepID=UPI00228024BA|nr:hypothetical protein [Bacillus inaquosorum]MCY8798188.1 hypothetical protein [Bacillus inaquosorum]MEC0772940.1 hypothetical protein [Bacillus inaquosorum]MEC0797011.1 hypothetical protein [Bacillus inaquosorum]